jgi:general secretion pathway protein J
MRSDRHSRGLTLVELLVAIAVLAIISVLGWRGLDVITRTRLILNEELAQTRDLQLVFAQLQIDCANAVDADTLAGARPMLIEANRLTLARRLQPEAQAGALQLVTWRWRDSLLTREETPPTRDLNQLARDWQLAQNGSASAVKLHSGVQQMVLRVWTDDGAGWRTWQPMTATQTVWRGLEVSLQLPGRAANMTKIFMLGAL